MGSSSSKPTRIIMSEDEAKGLPQSDRQTPEDTLNIPVLEQNYPDVKPPTSRHQTGIGGLNSGKSGRLSERRSVLPDIIESTEYAQNNQTKEAGAAVPNSVTKVVSVIKLQSETNAMKSHTNTSQTELNTPQSVVNTPRPVSYEGTTTPLTTQYRAGQYLQPNVLYKGHSNMSVLHRGRESVTGSLLSNTTFNDMNFKLDSDSKIPLKKREIMLLERERVEYQQLLDQEAFNLLPERSPRVQAPTKLAKALVALQNPEQFTGGSLRNRDYSIADQKATEHKDHKATTYSSLIQDLTAGLQNDALKVWAILSWISKQAIGRISFGKKVHDPNTPNGYMQLIQNNKGTFPVFFALLCRTAGIPCAVIHGISKSSNYELGSQNIDDLRSSWNAVFVADGWRLVHPLWVCRSLRGHRQGGWLTIEKDGQASKKLQVEDKGTEVSTYNSYYIFVEPKEFIYRNFPDEVQWQLLKEPWSREEFVNSAYLRPEFFKRKLKLLSDNKCVLVSEDGKPCNVVVGLDHDNASDMVFKYDLSIRVDTPDLLRSIKKDGADAGQTEENTNNATDSKTFLTENQNANSSEGKNRDDVTETNDDNESTTQKHMDNSGSKAVDEVMSVVKERHANLHNFVAVFREADTARFEIRFLKKNTYRLRIFGGLLSIFGSDPPCIMEVKLECLANITEPKPLPFDPGIVGWGPGPVAESLGLFVPSHENGVIEISEDEETVIQFFLKKIIQVEVTMFQTDSKDTLISHYVHYKILELRETYELRILILYPGNGEYAVKIDVLDSQKSQKENACNYLVKTGKERPYEEFYTRKARRMLLEAMLDVDTGALEVAVESCKQFGLPDDDPEYKGGKNRLAFLQARRALKECLLVNRIDVTEEAIYRAKTARFRVILTRDIKKAERHLEDICKLNEGGWNNQVPDIDRQTLFEMCRLRKPKEEIVHTMRAVYMLLGVNGEDVKTWNQIQLLMRKGEATIVEIARLEKYLGHDEVEILSPSEEVLDDVSEILTTYTEEDVRKIDNTAAAYYRWAVEISAKLRKHHQRMRELHGNTSKEGDRDEIHSAVIKTADQELLNGVAEQLDSATA